VDFIFTLQNETAGAQAFSYIDVYLAPFIRADRLSQKEVTQAVQEFIFNMNVPTRVGGQSPFSNVTLGAGVPEFMRDMPSIVGGKPAEPFGDFEEEVEMFNRAFAEVMCAGDAEGRVFTFPIPTYNITADFDWSGGIAEGIFGMAAKYGIPYFANFVNSDMEPEDTMSMCLHGEEELLIMDDGKIRRILAKDLEKYARGFDGGGWAEPKKTIYALSLNPATMTTEWKRVRRILRTCSKEMVVITTADGKTIKVTPEHPIPVLSPNGIILKPASRIRANDFMMTLRNCKTALNRKYQHITLEYGRRKKISDDQLKKALELGLSDKEIAEAFGMCKDQVGRRRRRLGLKPNVKSSASLKPSEAARLLKTKQLLLDERLAMLLGYFTAEGNYLHRSPRRGRKLRGLQFSFSSRTAHMIGPIKALVKELFGKEPAERRDPRYDIVYLYVYSSNIAESLYKAGFKKYGKLPEILFNSPPSVIEAFIHAFYLGDGYKKRREIHMNDKELARDLVLLASMVGLATCYKERKSSQRIYFQKTNSKPGFAPLCRRLPPQLRVTPRLRSSS